MYSATKPLISLLHVVQIAHLTCESIPNLSDMVYHGLPVLDHATPADYDFTTRIGINATNLVAWKRS